MSKPLVDFVNRSLLCTRTCFLFILPIIYIIIFALLAILLFTLMIISLTGKWKISLFTTLIGIVTNIKIIAKFLVQFLAITKMIYGL